MTYLPRLRWATSTPESEAASRNAKSDYFDDSAGSSGPINGLAAKWSTLGASQTQAFTRGAITITGTAAASAAPNISAIEQAAPSTPYTIRTTVTQGVPVQFAVGGLFVRESSGGKIWSIIDFYNSAGWNGKHLGIDKYTNVTTRSAFSDDTNIAQAGDMHLQVINNGTNLIAQYSWDAVEWVTLKTEALTTFFSGLTIDRIGIYTNPLNPTTPVRSFRLFEVS